MKKRSLSTVRFANVKLLAVLYLRTAKFKNKGEHTFHEK